MELKSIIISFDLIVSFSFALKWLVCDAYRLHLRYCVVCRPILCVINVCILLVIGCEIIGGRYFNLFELSTLNLMHFHSISFRIRLIFIFFIFKSSFFVSSFLSSVQSIQLTKLLRNEREQKMQIDCSAFETTTTVSESRKFNFSLRV